MKLERAVKMKIRENSGFTLLEMVIAMSIIAVVLAFSLMLMGDGMRRAVKANAIVTATALSQYEIDRVRNIAFPPTTDDRQDEFSKTKDVWYESQLPNISIFFATISPYHY